MAALIRTLSVLAALLLASLPIGAAPRLVVVELFTSQGCSSCPPADALLSELARRPDVLALAWHVDYWDHLGWKDPFSIAAATQRQRGYVRRLARSGAFTPQVVVSGDTSLVGSNRSAVTNAIAADRDALQLSLGKSEKTLTIEIQDTWHELMDVHLMAYRDRATSRIARGENAGRMLEYSNIVRSHRHVGVWNGKPQTLRVPLAALPRDATSVAVLLQRRQQGAIAGSARISLR